MRRTRSKKNEKRRFNPCFQRLDHFDDVLVFPVVSSEYLAPHYPNTALDLLSERPEQWLSQQQQLTP